jgi:hypothetical protein
MGLFLTVVHTRYLSICPIFNFYIGCYIILKDAFIALSIRDLKVSLFKIGMRCTFMKLHQGLVTDEELKLHLKM